jgi:hypothetical protein
MDNGDDRRFRWHWYHQRRRISFGRPAFTNRKGDIVIDLNSNLIGFFPLLVNGAAPPATDVFTVTPSDATKFSVAIGTMPSGADQGDPAVIVTPLTLAGATGLSFTVVDNADDTQATETFSIIPPAQPPGAIEVDDPNVVTQPNPNPPTV